MPLGGKHRMTKPDAGTIMRIEVDGIPISYEVRGEGAPILLIHGWSASHDYMLADLEPIFDAHPGWRRTYVDLPGHGATPAPELLATQDQMVSVLTGFIEATMPRRASPWPATPMADTSPWRSCDQCHTGFEARRCWLRICPPPTARGTPPTRSP